MTPEDHNRTLGILHLVYGGLHGLFTLAMIGLFLFVFGAVESAPGSKEMDGFFFLLMAVIMTFTLIFTIPSFVAGYGLMKRKSWAKLWGMIGGVIAGMSFPLGTALCVYTLWFLLGDQGKELYGESMIGQRPRPREALYGAPTPAGWAAQYAKGGREREYAPPPPPPPNWHD
jgi:hypothetical protein